jgi:hypothetical protein
LGALKCALRCYAGLDRLKMRAISIIDWFVMQTSMYHGEHS